MLNVVVVVSVVVAGEMLGAGGWLQMTMMWLCGVPVCLARHYSGGTSVKVGAVARGRYPAYSKLEADGRQYIR